MATMATAYYHGYVCILMPSQALPWQWLLTYQATPWLGYTPPPSRQPHGKDLRLPGATVASLTHCHAVMPGVRNWMPTIRYPDKPVSPNEHYYMYHYTCIHKSLPPSARIPPLECTTFAPILRGKSISTETIYSTLVN